MEYKKGTMEERKLKEIEAKLNRLLVQSIESKKSEATPSSLKKYHGVEVIRRRKGHTDLHIA